MRNDLTDITMVIDRSRSMERIKSDAEGGINTFIEEQKKAEGNATLTLVQFDHEYEFVHNGIPVADVPLPFKLHPRGSTALRDAVGRAIGEAGKRLEALEESQRPGLVVFVIVSDGLENASREFSGQQIKEMIERQQSMYKWRFDYLGTNQDAVAAATDLGIKTSGAAGYSPQNVGMAYATSSDKLKRARGMLRAGAGSVEVDKAMEFTAEERAKLEK